MLLQGEGDGSAAGTPPAPTGAEWQAGLPDDLKTEIATNKWGSHLEPIKGKDWNEVGPTLVRSYVHAQSKIGQKVEGMVKVPGKDAKPEEVTAFRTALGVPEKVEKYAEGIKLPEAKGWTPPTVQALSAILHKEGIPPASGQAIINQYFDAENKAVAAQKAEWEAGLDKLMDDWGEEKYKHQVTLANRAIEHFATPGLKEMIKAEGWGDHPEVLQTWAKIGHQLAEDGYIESSVTGAATNDELRAKINAVRADKNDPYNMPGHRDHEKRTAEVMGWYKQVYGTDEATPKGMEGFKRA